MLILLIMLGFLLSFAAIADILRSPVDDIRLLSPSAWLLVVILIPYFGALAWVLAGKPHDDHQGSESVAVMPPRTYVPPRVVGPDDDPAFLASLNDKLRRHDDDSDSQ